MLRPVPCLCGGSSKKKYGRKIRSCRKKKPVKRKGREKKGFERRKKQGKEIDFYQEPVNPTKKLRKTQGKSVGRTEKTRTQCIEIDHWEGLVLRPSASMGEEDRY